MKSQFALALAGAALISLPAMAQTSNVPNPRPATPATTSTTNTTDAETLKPGEWRATKLAGVDVYNSNKEKIGAIKELILDKSGTIKSAVVGAGGFLGMGEHDVAVPFTDVKWSDEPIAPTNTSGTAGKPADETNRGYPDHATLDMTKDQLKALPEMQYTK